MSTRFHTDLNNLRKQVLKLGRLAKEMLEKSIEALVNQDMDLAEKIKEKKVEAAKLDNEIEEEVLDLLTLYQPMADDIRTVACILKAITYLTRISRYAKVNCNIALHLATEPHVKKLVSIPLLAQEVHSMIEDVLLAFEKNDISYFQGFEERDDMIDELDHSIFRECITYMMEDPQTITRCTRYIMVSRNLERCADHACKIAEKVHYMTTGEHIEIS